MKKIKLIASPGIAIVEPIEKDSSSLNITSKSESRILEGKVISVGPSTVDHGAIIMSLEFCQEGDVIRFLSYEGNYDNFMIDDKKYYCVKWQDIRCIQK